MASSLLFHHRTTDKDSQALTKASWHPIIKRVSEYHSPVVDSKYVPNGIGTVSLSQDYSIPLWEYRTDMILLQVEVLQF